MMKVICNQSNCPFQGYEEECSHGVPHELILPCIHQCVIAHHGLGSRAMCVEVKG